MYALLNLMSAEKAISFTCTASILGYCLLPMALLSMLAAVLSFQVCSFYLLAEDTSLAERFSFCVM